MNERRGGMIGDECASFLAFGLWRGASVEGWWRCQHTQPSGVLIPFCSLAVSSLLSWRLQHSLLHVTAFGRAEKRARGRARRRTSIPRCKLPPSDHLLLPLLTTTSRPDDFDAVLDNVSVCACTYTVNRGRARGPDDLRQACAGRWLGRCNGNY